MERKCEAGETDDAATGLVGVTKTGREQGRIGSTQVVANDAPLEIISFDASPDEGYEAEGDDRRKMIGRVRR